MTVGPRGDKEGSLHSRLLTPVCQNETVKQFPQSRIHCGRYSGKAARHSVLPGVPNPLPCMCRHNQTRQGRPYCFQVPALVYVISSWEGAKNSAFCDSTSLRGFEFPRRSRLMATSAFQLGSCMPYRNSFTLLACICSRHNSKVSARISYVFLTRVAC